MGDYEDRMAAQHQAMRLQDQQLRLNQAQTQYLERQNRDYMTGIATGSTQRSWEGLSDLDGFSPRTRPSQASSGFGAELVVLAALAAGAYVVSRIANRPPVSEAPPVWKTKGYKNENVVARWVLVGITLHALLIWAGLAVSGGDQVIGVFLMAGLVAWVGAGLFGLLHNQQRVYYNNRLRAQRFAEQNERDAL